MKRIIAAMESHSDARVRSAALRKIGDAVTETLDYLPGRFKIIRHIRTRLTRLVDLEVGARSTQQRFEL